MYYYAVDSEGLHAFLTLEDRTHFCGKTLAKECNLDGRYKHVLYWDHMQCAALQQFGLIYLLATLTGDDTDCNLTNLNKWLAKREHDYINNYNSRLSWLEYMDLYVGYYMSAKCDCAEFGHRLTFKDWFEDTGYSHVTIFVTKHNS